MRGPFSAVPQKDVRGVRTTFFSIFWQYFTFGTILACAALRATLFKKTKTFKEVDERREKRGRKDELVECIARY